MKANTPFKRETRLGISTVTPAAGAEDAATHLEFADNRLLVDCVASMTAT